MVMVGCQLVSVLADNDTTNQQKQTCYLNWFMVKRTEPLVLKYKDGHQHTGHEPIQSMACSINQ